MFELGVTASNGNFFGRTEVYETSDSLKCFAESLEGFPSSTDKSRTIFHEAGQKSDYAYFSMKLYCIDPSGKVGVHINLESNVATKFRSEEKDKLSLEIIVEPVAIDTFQKELLHLAVNEEGFATLMGISD
ncbi:MAG: hypothetical protein NVV82_22265 [Sporocytophaga sp.]|nr:hypothetical protein [Sporocytophaga sp.]